LYVEAGTTLYQGDIRGTKMLAYEYINHLFIGNPSTKAQSFLYRHPWVCVCKRPKHGDCTAYFRIRNWV